LLGSFGCAGFWDEVTSRDFKLQALFDQPHPMEVLAHSSDGDKRATALRSLREPKQYGGTDAEQDQVVTLLIRAAVSERQALCRLAAIQALGRFKDPRAVQGLIDAYYAVTEQRLDPTALASKRAELVNTFSPEMVTRIQCQALTSLGQTGSPMAVELLTTVAREPQPEGQARQQAIDVRIAAARALARYPQHRTAEALVHVLRTEKDVALRDAAHESLQASTGKKLPPDPKAWERLLRPGGEEAATAGADRPGPHRPASFVPGTKPNPLEPRQE
jgi:hypothetical protein